MCECFPLCVLVCYLLSAEQKKATQGLGVLMSVEGDRYMASEKQVKSSFSSSVLNTREGCGSREKEAGCEKHVKCKKTTYTETNWMQHWPKTEKTITMCYKGPDNVSMSGRKGVLSTKNYLRSTNIDLISHVVYVRGQWWPCHHLNISLLIKSALTRQL